MQGVKGLFKEQGRSINFKVMIHNKFIYLVSDSPLQLIFKKLSLVEFWCTNKDDHP